MGLRPEISRKLKQVLSEEELSHAEFLKEVFLKLSRVGLPLVCDLLHLTEVGDFLGVYS